MSSPVDPSKAAVAARHGSIAQSRAAAVAQRLLAGVAQQLYEGVLLLDRSGTVLVANEAAAELLGSARAEIEHRPADEALRRLAAGTVDEGSTLAELTALVSSASAGRSGATTVGSAGMGRPPVDVRAGPVSTSGTAPHDVCVVLQPRPGTTAGGAQARSDDEGGSGHIETLSLLAEALRADVAGLAQHAKRHDGESAERIGRVQQDVGMLAQALKALATIERVRATDRPGAGRRVDVGDVLMAVLPLWKPRAPNHAFELALAGEAPGVAADEHLLTEAVNTLLEAAVNWTPLGGVIRVSVRRADAGAEVAIRPFTTGPFLGPREPAQAYVAFPNGLEIPESAVRGGLGMHMAQAIVRAHGGTLQVEQARAGEPLSFRLWWPEPAPGPRASDPERSRPAPEPASALATVARPAVRAGVLPRRGRSAVVICDADQRMLRYVRANLEQQHYQAVVATTLREVPHVVEMEEPAAVMLDVGADEPALCDVLRRVCELTAAPVLLLAHRHDPDQCARLLDMGAADYIAKPFSIDELLARLRAATRTRAADELDEGERVVATGDLTIDLGRRVVSVAGADVHLSRTEFKLLKALAQHAGAVLSHDELLARVWGASYRQETDFVWVYMRRLRRKIEPDPAHPRYLLTTPGVGYRLAKLPVPAPA